MTVTMRRTTAPEAVLIALRGDVMRGHLGPGEQIVQETLAERYGVSRSPLREALKILEGEGLVTYHPHRGYFVTELSVDDLLEVYRLRQVLEAEALTAAVEHLTTEDCQDIGSIASEVERAMATGDLVAITEANRRFHFALFEASRMPRLVRLLRQLWDATDAYRTVYFAEEGNRAKVAAEHRAMVAAIDARDADALIHAHDSHRANAVIAVSAAIRR